MSKRKHLARAIGDGKPSTMKGIITTQALVAGAVTAALIVAGCRKGKESATAARPERETSSSTETMVLRGTYAYMADAALFVDCVSGKRWPVATEGNNAALERAYLDDKESPGAPLLVSVKGRLESRPRVDGQEKEIVLIVERFVRTWPGKSCGSIDVATLEDTHWELLELNGTPVATPPGGKAPYLELNSKKASAYGFGGCNRFFGSYRSSGQTLELGALGATRMACPDGMDREQELFAALDSVTRYEIQGSKLLLFADSKLVARFEARPSTQ